MARRGPVPHFQGPHGPLGRKLPGPSVLKQAEKPPQGYALAKTGHQAFYSVPSWGCSKPEQAWNGYTPAIPCCTDLVSSQKWNPSTKHRKSVSWQHRGARSSEPSSLLNKRKKTRIPESTFAASTRLQTFDPKGRPPVMTVARRKNCSKTSSIQFRARCALPVQIRRQSTPGWISLTFLSPNNHDQRFDNLFAQHPAGPHRAASCWQLT